MFIRLSKILMLVLGQRDIADYWG